MFNKILMTVEDKEKLFQTELIKSGVPHADAVKVARILACGQWEDELSCEDQQLVERACQRWLNYRRILREITSSLQVEV